MNDFPKSMNTPHDALSSALAEAQRIGALGPLPIPEAIEHARSYVRAISPGDRSLIDIGSGGGLPGLVIAVECTWLDRIVLIDRRAKRTDLLRRLVGRLGLRDRVEVVEGDVVAYGRSEQNMSSFDVATARSFGTPLLLAQAASPLLRDGGRLLVSEPPDSNGERWHEPTILGMFHVKPVIDGLASLERADST
jgi:16S rRNA (guanine527-N7)-methyltransferase